MCGLGGRGINRCGWMGGCMIRVYDDNELEVYIRV